MDSDLWIQILELVVLLTLSGFFSSAETAMVSVSKIRLRTLEEEGNKKAALALKILENQSKMLSAILIGNNLVNTSAASIASLIAYSFGGAAVSIATFIITFLILVFGEITPKTWATINADKLAIAYAPIILLLMKVLTPVIWFVNLFSSGILKLMGIQNSNKNISMTESELRTIVDVSHEEGVIEEDEKDMINKVFDLGDAKAKDVMVPKMDVEFVELNLTYDELIAAYSKEKFTRMPVYDDSRDNVVGIINLKDLFFYQGDKNDFKISDVMREAYFTYEYKKISELFFEMKSASIPMAIVLDEYGSTSGILTIEDLIEEIVGEIRDEYDTNEEDDITKTENGDYIILGVAKLDDIDEALGIKIESEDYDSIAGHIINLLDHFPDAGETVSDDYATYTVLEAAKNHIDKVKLHLLPKSNNNDDELSSDDNTKEAHSA